MIHGKRKLVLVALSLLLLLANPAGFCAGNMTSASGGHPCCPKAPSVKSSCLCIDRQSAAPAVTVSVEAADTIVVYFQPQPSSVELPVVAQETPPDRAVVFHQLLI
jgi:hypothetical protein